MLNKLIFQWVRFEMIQIKTDFAFGIGMGRRTVGYRTVEQEHEIDRMHFMYFFEIQQMFLLYLVEGRIFGRLLVFNYARFCCCVHCFVLNKFYLLVTVTLPWSATDDTWEGQRTGITNDSSTNACLLMATIQYEFAKKREK